MRIILIRHGDPDYIHDSLTEKGQEEAKLLANRIREFDPEVTAYFVSPLGRARETADWCLKPLGKTATVLPWIEEFTGRIPDPEDGHLRLGWDLLPQDWMYDKRCYEADNWWNADVFKGSNCKEAYDRITEGFDALVKEYGYTRKNGLSEPGHCYRTDWEHLPEQAKDGRETTIVIFCHMIATFTILSYVSGIAFPVMAHGFFSAPTGWNVLETEERIPGEAHFRIRAVGDISHLNAAHLPLNDSGFFPGVGGNAENMMDKALKEKQ